MAKGLYPTLCFALMGAAVPAFAQSSHITENLTAFQTTLNGQPLRIVRSGPVCPPSCVTPMQAASGVATVGELEVLDFLELFVSEGRGLLVDARLPEAFSTGTVPGSVNVPASTLAPENPYRDDLLEALGVRSGDFSGAFDLVLFAGGADDGLAAAAVRNLLDAGYPPTKLKFYRGGLKAWDGLGLSLAAGQ